jgi:DNA-binding CsgD family transcriptional regulator
MVVIEGGAELERRHGLRAVPLDETRPSRGGRTGRRWDDHPGHLPTLTFARFLESQPSVDDIGRFLVALLCWPVAAQGVLVVRGGDGGLRSLGGYVEQVPDWPADGSLPAAVRDIVAATSNRPVFRTESCAEGEHLVAAWPLGSVGHRVGILAVLLSEPLEARLVESRAEGIPETLAVYLIGATAKHQMIGAPEASGTSSPDQDSLTSRQVKILSLMSRGMTNAQIAARIGFSASTVRMESLVIYRVLGVHDRQDAVASARLLGVVAHY